MADCYKLGGDLSVSFQRSLPVLPLPRIPPAVNTRRSRSAILWHSFHTHLSSTQTIRWKCSQQRCHCEVSGFQLISAAAGSSSLFDVAGRSGFVRYACPRLCQIKGQRLDGEATLLFIPVQPRERPNKSGGNVVTRESERSLPTGWGKWRDSLIKSSRLRVFLNFFYFFYS